MLRDVARRGRPELAVCVRAALCTQHSIALSVCGRLCMVLYDVCSV